MSVPIGDVLGIMALFIEVIVLLLIELINAKKQPPQAKVAITFC